MSLSTIAFGAVVVFVCSSLTVALVFVALAMATVNR